MLNLGSGVVRRSPANCGLGSLSNGLRDSTHGLQLGVLVVAFGDKERGSSLLVPPPTGQIGARRIPPEARYRWGHGSPRVIRRWILSILLFALIATVPGWQEAVPQTRAVDGAVTLPRPLAAAIDAVVRARPDTLAGGFAEQRSAKARPRLDFLPVLSLAVLVAVALSRPDQPGPGRPSILWRRHRVSLRAPPLLRLT